MISKEIEFVAIVQSQSDEIKELARKTRALIYKLYPKVVEIIWFKQKTAGFGTGPKKMSEHFCWIMPTKSHVNLGFNYGSELPDPGCLLEGTGKMFRHVKIKTLNDLEDKDLEELIKYASSYRMP